jgi:hypothetical protein
VQSTTLPLLWVTDLRPSSSTTAASSPQAAADGPDGQQPLRRIAGTLRAADALAGAAGVLALGGGAEGADGEAGRGAAGLVVEGGGPGAAADQGAARTWASCAFCGMALTSAPAKIQCSQTVKVDRLMPFHALVDYPPAPGQVSA